MAYRIGILGATGAVGREMLNILEERRFPVAELRLFASEKSAGKALLFQGQPVPVQAAEGGDFSGLDLVLGAASKEVARTFAPIITGAGAVFIDNSSAFRADPTVPLVVPEINPEDAKAHRGIVANPNCSTIIALTALNPLHRLSPLQSVVASTYQAVSGAGAAGIQELLEELPPQVFPYPIRQNVIPQIGEEAGDGYTGEELKMQNEGRKILHAPHLCVSCTCVRVPVLRSHSISLCCRFARPISPDEARSAIAAAPGCRLADDLSKKRYPMPLTVSGQDTVEVGRIRPDLTDSRGLCLWCCGDQLRKGAATNAVQIAALLFPPA